MPKEDLETGSVRPWGGYLLLVFIWTLTVPLLGAFWVQFVWKENPCPLCLMQRMCMALAGIGVVWILSADGEIDRAAAQLRWSRGFAVAVLAATLGLCISLRQILIHISPDDPGFGTPILGYHLYSWAFGIFIVILLCSGISLLMTEAISLISKALRESLLTRMSIWIFGLIILANALVVGFTAAMRLLP